MKKTGSRLTSDPSLAAVLMGVDMVGRLTRTLSDKGNRNDSLGRTKKTS